MKFDLMKFYEFLDAYFCFLLYTLTICMTGWGISNSIAQSVNALGFKLHLNINSSYIHACVELISTRTYILMLKTSILPMNVLTDEAPYIIEQTLW